jgi:hypothetical protein
MTPASWQPGRRFLPNALVLFVADLFHSVGGFAVELFLG